MANDLKITVLNPEVERKKLSLEEPSPRFPGSPEPFRFEPSEVILAKRLDTLENKTIYLVDIGFGGGQAFMQQVQKWFGEHMPSVTTILRRKPGSVFMDTDNEDLWKEIKAKGHAAIIGVAG
jgi:hypothetical protein